MSFVRRVLSEEISQDRVIRRYEVEYSPYDMEYCLADRTDRFDKLVTLELWLTHAAAERFRHVPYMLADAIWTCGTDCHCGWNFDPDTRNIELIHGVVPDRVLLYTLMDQIKWGAGPVPIAVELWNEEHPLWNDRYWWRKREVSIWS